MASTYSGGGVRANRAAYRWHTVSCIYRSYMDVHRDSKRFAKELILAYRAVAGEGVLHTCNGNTTQSERIRQRWEQYIADHAGMGWFFTRFHMIQLLVMKI